MSLYNQLFGVNPLTPVILRFIGITHEEVPRFRDVFVDNGEIVIYTRTGGGNRQEYDSEDCPSPNNKDLRQIPGFIRDYDDDFDSTFAYFHYTVPEKYREDINHVVELSKDRPPPRQLWDTMLNDLRNDKDTGLARHAKEVGEKIIEKINDPETDGVIKV